MPSLLSASCVPSFPARLESYFHNFAMSFVFCPLRLQALYPVYLPFGVVCHCMPLGTYKQLTSQLGSLLQPGPDSFHPWFHNVSHLNTISWKLQAHRLTVGLVFSPHFTTFFLLPSLLLRSQSFSTEVMKRLSSFD